MNKLYIIVLMMPVYFCTSCIMEEVSEYDRHYTTGKTAYQCYEESFGASSSLFYEAKRLDDFIGYMENKTLIDAGALKVWLEAEEIYFPSDKPRKDNDTWYILNGADTLCIIDTQGHRFDAFGSCWLAKRPHDTVYHKFVCVGENEWNLILENYCRPDSMYDYYSCYYDMSVDANLLFTIKDSLQYNVTGDYNLTLYECQDDSCDSTSFVLTSTIGTPLTYSVPDYCNHYGIVSAGQFSFVIHDPATNASEEVNVSIVSDSTGKKRNVCITYKDDVICNSY